MLWAERPLAGAEGVPPALAAAPRGPDEPVPPRAAGALALLAALAEAGAPRGRPPFSSPGPRRRRPRGAPPGSAARAGGGGAGRARAPRPRPRGALLSGLVPGPGRPPRRPPTAPPSTPSCRPSAPSPSTPGAPRPAPPRPPPTRARSPDVAAAASAARAALAALRGAPRRPWGARALGGPGGELAEAIADLTRAGAAPPERAAGAGPPAPPSPRLPGAADEAGDARLRADPGPALAALLCASRDPDSFAYLHAVRALGALAACCPPPPSRPRRRHRRPLPPLPRAGRGARGAGRAGPARRARRQLTEALVDFARRLGPLLTPHAACVVLALLEGRGTATPACGPRAPRGHPRPCPSRRRGRERAAGRRRWGGAAGAGARGVALLRDVLPAALALAADASPETKKKQCKRKDGEPKRSLYSMVKMVLERMGNMETSIEELKVRIGNVETSIEELKNRVGNVEKSIGRLENRVGNVEKSIGGLEMRLNSTLQCVGTLAEDNVRNSMRSQLGDGANRAMIKSIRDLVLLFPEPCQEILSTKIMDDLRQHQDSLIEDFFHSLVVLLLKRKSMTFFTLAGQELRNRGHEVDVAMTLEIIAAEDDNAKYLMSVISFLQDQKQVGILGKALKNLCIYMIEEERLRELFSWKDTNGNIRYAETAIRLVKAIQLLHLQKQGVLSEFGELSIALVNLRCNNKWQDHIELDCRGRVIVLDGKISAELGEIKLFPNKSSLDSGRKQLVAHARLPSFNGEDIPAVIHFFQKEWVYEIPMDALEEDMAQVGD
eukprot:tig00001057_g6686.t1